MRRIVLLILLSLALPASAHASPRQVVTFEAPRELLSASTRDATLDQITSLRHHERAPARLLARLRARRRTARPSRPASTRATPTPIPPTSGTTSTGWSPPRKERGVSVTLTLTGPVPKWATRGKRDNVTDPDPKEFGAFATAIGRRYGDAVTTWSVWNEPNQPQFLKPAVQERQAVLAEALPQALPGRLRGPARDAGQRRTTRSCSARRRRAATPTSSHPLAFLRGMLCLDSKYRKAKSCKELPAERLRPPRVHDVGRPALGAGQQGRRDDRRAAAAGDRARQAPPRRARCPSTCRST